MENISDFIEQTTALVPLTDVRVLVLLWKFNAVSKPAQISKKEWMAACHNHLIDSVDKLKALVPSLDAGFLDQNEFKDFYKVRACCIGCRCDGVECLSFYCLTRGRGRDR